MKSGRFRLVVLGLCLAVASLGVILVVAFQLRSDGSIEDGLIRFPNAQLNVTGDRYCWISAEEVFFNRLRKNDIEPTLLNVNTGHARVVESLKSLIANYRTDTNLMPKLSWKWSPDRKWLALLLSSGSNNLSALVSTSGPVGFAQTNESVPIYSPFWMVDSSGWIELRPLKRGYSASLNSVGGEARKTLDLTFVEGAPLGFDRNKHFLFVTENLTGGGVKLLRLKLTGEPALVHETNITLPKGTRVSRACISEQGDRIVWKLRKPERFPHLRMVWEWPFVKAHFSQVDRFFVSDINGEKFTYIGYVDSTARLDPNFTWAADGRHLSLVDAGAVVLVPLP